TDLAGALPPGTEKSLNDRLGVFEEETSNQVVVWIDRRIPEGWDLEAFAAQAVEEWGIGQKSRDNGVLLLVFTEDRKARIEVGYGLEGTLPDALAHRIIAEAMIPRFREQDYSGGIEAGVEGILAATRGEFEGTGPPGERERDRGSERGPSGWGVLGLVLFFVFLTMLLSRSRGRRGGWMGWPLGLPYGGWTYHTGGRSSEGWSSGGGFSGRGLSGGGGMSGGGGASGSW
ncbi:MAG: TPM domain-containing protein, partial [Actinomycetota bacterium]